MVSANHQVTIPMAVFWRAGLRVGERLSVEADDTGRIILRRVSELAERQLGLLSEPTASD